MQIPMNDKRIEVKYTFKSIKAWHRQFPKAKDDDDLYDEILSGLIGDNPMVLIKVLYGGVAHLDGDMPSFEDFFDSANEYLATRNDGTDTFAETIAELAHSGFFGLQVKNWKQRMENYKEVSETLLSELLKDEEAKKKKDYNSILTQARQGVVYIKTVLKNWDAKQKAIENG
jgi:hypothetical protein